MLLLLCFSVASMGVGWSIGNTKPLFTRAHPPEPPSTPSATTTRHWEPPPASPERQLGNLAGSPQDAGWRREYSSRPPDDGGSERFGQTLRDCQ